MFAVSPDPIGSDADRVPPTRPERLWAVTLQRLSRGVDGGLALTLSLPFCATHCLCCNRDVRGAAPSAEVGAYVDGLLLEMRLLGRCLGGRRRVSQVHLAGGSVTELGEVPLLRLFDGLREGWQLAADAEVTAHADVRRFAPGQLRLLHGQGVTRLVLGVLDFDPRVQQAAGRRQPVDLVADACAQARAQGLDDLQIDLMVGLPGQTEAGWQATLGQVLALAPQLVRLRQYRHQPRQSPVQSVFEIDALPDRTRCRRLEQQGRQQLQSAGYLPLGADLFGRGQQRPLPADGRLPALGCGAGAASRVDGRVFFNHGRLADWQAMVQSGRLPVSHTRRQVWALPGERPRPSGGREPSAFDRGRRDRRADAHP
jgi:oxygen-independent coproporphyrinogen-3 oxidase